MYRGSHHSIERTGDLASDKGVRWGCKAHCTLVEQSQLALDTEDEGGSTLLSQSLVDKIHT